YDSGYSTHGSTTGLINSEGGGRAPVAGGQEACGPRCRQELFMRPVLDPPFPALSLQAPGSKESVSRVFCNIDRSNGVPRPPSRSSRFQSASGFQRSPAIFATNASGFFPVSQPTRCHPIAWPTGLDR